eukprot:gnl/Dysnectes_brevis/128_a151_12108.p1 GENE.gnl/Dysnectes_brevis/128_a151_12108~~gnl/Dysnectes_brevis/128_a151_12108.p1  ORF type:complete len:130 (+),score=4.40 gnl/Dysnectes_brevis/128_a151_12108:54-392(+)
MSQWDMLDLKPRTKTSAHRKPSTSSTKTKGGHSTKVVGEDTFGSKQSNFYVRTHIQQARAAKKWTRDDLARQASIKASIIASWETGKAVPTAGQINRLERVLGVRLRPEKKK